MTEAGRPDHWGVCFESPDERRGSELGTFRKRGKLLIVTVWDKGAGGCGGSGAQDKGQGWGPQPRTAFEMRVEWPQGGIGLARRKQENPQGEGWAGMIQERAREGLVREGQRRASCKEEVSEDWECQE